MDSLYISFATDHDATDGSQSESGHINIEDGAYDLRVVLNTMKRALHMMGFDYVGKLTAHSDIRDHSSTN